MRITIPALIIAAAATLSAQSTPTLPAETLLDRAVLKALDEELSGVPATDHAPRPTPTPRVPPSPGFPETTVAVTGPARGARRFTTSRSSSRLRSSRRRRSSG